MIICIEQDMLTSGDSVPMNDFDPVVFLSPVLAIIASILLLLIIRKKSRLRANVVVFALISYAAAIALKEIVQYFSLSFIYDHFGKISLLTGLYFGLQTSIFEVFGALYYVVDIAGGFVGAIAFGYVIGILYGKWALQPINDDIIGPGMAN